ncbi:PAS domain S-box/diguanylate cyclase (GGDEF) domain-containing protein [Gammaproteobacteria bacterium]
MTSHFWDLVTQGTADYGISNSEILLWYAKDKQVVSLATPLQHSRLSLVIADDRHIDTVHDLAGHTIMLSPEAVSIRAYLHAEGLEGKVRILPSTEKWEDVASGKVDAMDVYLSRDLKHLTRQGIHYKVFRPTSAGIDFYGQVLFTAAQRVHNYPRQVEAFRAASLKGWNYALRHSQEMIDWLLKTYPRSNNREDLEWEAMQIRKLMVIDLVEVGYQNPNRWRHIADTMADLNMLPRDYPVKDLIYSPPGKFNLRPYYPYLAVGFGLVILLGTFAGYVSWVNARLRRSAIQLKEAASVFDNSSDGIFICDPQNCIQRVNQAFTAITGYTAEDVMGKNPSVLQSGRHDVHFYVALWHELLEKNHWSGDLWNRRKDGSLYPEWLTITVVRNGLGDIAGFIAQFNDISSHKQVEDETRYRGNYDPLTGLPNRYLLVERLKMALIEAHRYQRQVALLFVDLDYFKAINDTLGHLAGDQVLQEVAHRLTDCIRETDTAARQGGDEFIVVLQGIEGHEAMAQIAGHIISAMSKPFLIGKNAAYVGASIGIAISPEHGQDVITLMEKADIALYQAKEKGRNNYQFYHSD